MDPFQVGRPATRHASACIATSSLYPQSCRLLLTDCCILLADGAIRSGFLGLHLAPPSHLYAPSRCASLLCCCRVLAAMLQQAGGGPLRKAHLVGPNQHTAKAILRQQDVELMLQLADLGDVR